MDEHNTALLLEPEKVPEVVPAPEPEIVSASESVEVKPEAEAAPEVLDVSVPPETTDAPPPPKAPEVGNRGRMACGLLGLFIGGLGIHNFLLGQTGRGIAHIIIFIVSVIPLSFHVVGFFASSLLIVIPWVGGILYFIVNALGAVAVIFWVTLFLINAVWGAIEGIMILSNKDYRDADGNLLR